MRYLSGKLIIGLILLLNCSCQAPAPEKKSSTNEKVSSSQKHRPKFHFTPPFKWMNDPNGMVFYAGEYHLCYQYYPEDIVWGPMHWGHAVSIDLTNWQHLPIALYPDSLGYIFSGSAVIDWENTSGFGENGSPPMIAIFTHHDPVGEKAGTNTFQYQSIAFSNDKGRTWTKYAGNPVMPNPGIKDFRDPKVIWDKFREQWVMVFAVYDRVHLYTSADLKEWSFASEFGIPGDNRLWECPDLFPMQIDGDGETKWVLLTSIQKDAPNGGTATSYFIGDFDGKTFVANNARQFWADYGKDNYAMVTWSDIPESDGRRLAIGWMSNWQYAQAVPTETWRSAMTIPRELQLVTINNSLRLLSKPVEELKSLRAGQTALESRELIANQSTGPFQLTTGTAEVLLDIECAGGSYFVIEFANDLGEKLKVGIEQIANHWYIDRRNAGDGSFSSEFASSIHIGPVQKLGNNHKIHLFLDVASVELFANDGLTVMTDIFFPTEIFNKMYLSCKKGSVKINKGTLFELNPASLQ